MSNETKRDVLKEALRYVPTGCEYDLAEGKEAGNLAEQLLARYAAALPDDLLVIPEKVSSWIEHCYGSTNLLGILFTAMETYRTSEVTAWVVSHHESVARSWLLGVWCVEETGEIVKLEAEK